MSLGVKNEIEKWIFSFDYVTTLLKTKEQLLRFIVGFYAHLFHFVWKSIFLNVYRDFSGIETGTWSSRKVSLVWRCYSLYKLQFLQENMSYLWGLSAEIL